MTPDEQAAEIERLRAALRWQDDRDGRIGTHSPGCYSYGYRHYECALREIERLREALRSPDTRQALRVLTFLAFCARRDQSGNWVLTLDEPHDAVEHAKAFSEAVKAAYITDFERRAFAPAKQEPQDG